VSATSLRNPPLRLRTYMCQTRPGRHGAAGADPSVGDLPHRGRHRHVRVDSRPRPGRCHHRGGRAQRRVADWLSLDEHVRVETALRPAGVQSVLPPPADGSVYSSQGEFQRLSGERGGAIVKAGRCRCGERFRRSFDTAAVDGTS
jgi:hypothetical protein